MYFTDIRQKRTASMEFFLSAWCFQESMHQGKISLEQLPALSAHYEFSGIELTDRQLIPFSPDHLRAIRNACRASSQKVILDISSDLTLLDDEAWSAQLRYTTKMLEVASGLGARKVRILLGGQSFSLQKTLAKKRGGEVENGHVGRLKSLAFNPTIGRLSRYFRKRTLPRIKNETAKTEQAIVSLRRLLPIAQELGISMAIENHWGISSYPETILRIIEECPSRYLGTCPDFDNFPKNVDPYEGLDRLSANAIHVHAKSKTFLANGEEKYINYSRCMAILRIHHYDQSITIEYEGDENPLTGSLQTRALMLRHLKSPVP
jgi:sugar phosphate isomerase/epimerase